MIKHWFEEVTTDNLRAAGEEISVFTSENQCFIQGGAKVTRLSSPDIIAIGINIEYINGNDIW